MKKCKLFARVCKQKVFKMSTICADTCLETLSPLVNCSVDDVLSESGPKCSEWVSEWVNLYTAHYKQKLASVRQSRQTEMPLKIVWTAQIQCSVFAVWRKDCSILSVPPPKNSCIRAECKFVGTMRALASAERSTWRRPESAIAMSSQLTARYEGVSPRSDMKPT